MASLDAARAALLKMDATPSKRAEQKELQALAWLAAWGWSWPDLLDSLSGAARRGLAARLVSKGYAARIENPNGGGVRFAPRYAMTITDLGLTRLYSTCETEPPAPKTRIPWHQLRHDAICQYATKWALRNRGITLFEAAPRKMKKNFDCVWFGHNYTVGVEVELTRKKEPEMTAALAAIAESKMAGEIDQCVYVVPAPWLFRRYEKMLQSGEWGVFKREPNGRWRPTYKTLRDPEPCENWFRGALLDQNGEIEMLPGHYD